MFNFKKRAPLIPKSYLTVESGTNWGHRFPGFVTPIPKERRFLNEELFDPDANAWWGIWVFRLAQ